MVDSSHIDRNEGDQARRDAIHRDQLEYKTRKSSPDQWAEVLHHLNSAGIHGHLYPKIISNHILEKWWDVKFSPGGRPIYLAFRDLNLLIQDLSLGDHTPSESFESGFFHGLYRSVASSPKCKMVCFFLQRSDVIVSGHGYSPLDDRENHFFTVLFDYQAHKAYSFGFMSVGKAEVRVEAGAARGWAGWMGPSLWEAIAYEMGWTEGEQFTQTVEVVTKNWPQVSGAWPHRW